MSDTDRPDARPLIDFDHHSIVYRDTWVEMAADFHASGSPIGWTESHGGFWVVASPEAVHRVASEWETFTSVNDLDGTENGGMGQLIPRMEYRLHLGESDPPLHAGRRRIEAPFFAPKALRRWKPVVTSHLNEAIDAVIESGHADLVDDIIIPTTARTTLHVLGYDDKDWKDAADAAHDSGFLPPDHPDFPGEQMVRLRGRFREMLAERAANPTGDVISALALGTVDGEPLGLEVGESMINALVFGGFDTTLAATMHALIYLESHPDVVDRMIADPTFRTNAVEEFLRFYPPVVGMSRTAVKDTELMGQTIRRGERVFMWLAGTNRDPLTFENPDVLDLERANAREHVTFSAGHHRCLGSPLAKAELSEMITTIPTRLRNMRIDHAGLTPYPTLGLANGFSAAPVTFTPGEQLGTHLVSEGLH